MLKISIKNFIYLILYSIPNTIFSFGIIYIINNVISNYQLFLTDYMGIVFVSIVIYTYLLNIIFQKNLNKYSFEVLCENENRLFDKVLTANMITIEKFGFKRFYTVIEDLRIFSSFPQVLTHTVNSLLMLLLCMIYLFTLSISAATVIVFLIILIAGIYFFVIKRMSEKVSVLRKYNEDYYHYVNDLIKGFKDFKMSSRRRQNLREKYLYPNREKVKELDFEINYVFLSINMISQYGLYIVISVILFLLPQIGLLADQDVISYVIILLFVSGPVNNLINLQNIYTRLNVANRRIKEFLLDFDSPEKESESGENKDDFRSLVFDQVSFKYENHEKDSSFVLGPLNITIEKGEIIFIVGGNGSGKSTFINLLTGLYEPSDGKIILNGQVSVENQTSIQNMTTAVFTDNHISANNYDEYLLEKNSKYQELLQLMELDKVVTDDKEESARRQFSKGQSKRMSLIFALLEDKPILVLDEWAADQDPYFRKYFYEHLVPKLKKEGKSIIAVTHDDAYFSSADRIIRFDYGSVTKDFKMKDKTFTGEDLWYDN